MGLSLAVWTAETNRQQQPLLDSARLALAERRFTRPVADRTPSRRGLAGTLWSSVAALGDLCRSTPLSWRRLSCLQLDRTGIDPRLSTDPRRLQCGRRRPQAGLCASAVPPSSGA